MLLLTINHSVVAKKSDIAFFRCGTLFRCHTIALRASFAGSFEERTGNVFVKKKVINVIRCQILRLNLLYNAKVTTI